jgi:hypothetical protein
MTVSNGEVDVEGSVLDLRFGKAGQTQHITAFEDSLHYITLTTY